MKRIKSGVYKIENLVNGKIYIGSTVNFTDRKWQHFSPNEKSKRFQNIYLRRSMDFHGRENFIFKVIEYVDDKNKLIEREQYWIDKLHPEYNISRTAGSTLGVKCSEEKKQKLREINTGKIHSEETKQKISQGNIGKKCSKESIEKTASFNRGRKLSEEHKRKMSESHKGLPSNMKGKIHSKETKRKISNSRKGKCVGENHARSKAIICVETGIVYSNAMEVERKTGISNKHIGTVCKGKRKTTGGFHWRYFND